MVRAAVLPLTEPQSLFRASSDDICGFVAGRGSGKTVIGAIDSILRARNGDHQMCVSPNHKVLMETTWVVFCETASKLGVYRDNRKTPVPKVFFRSQDGGKAQMVFRSGEDSESLRGPTKSLLWIDEASIQRKDVLLYGAPVLRQRREANRLILTFTPKGRRHWTYELFYTRNQKGEYVRIPGRDLVQAHTLSNPFLPANYYDAIRALYTEALAQQELAGEFVDILGLMFQRHWFGRENEAPARARRVRYWDKASSEGVGSFTCGVLMSRTDNGRYLVEDVVRGRWSYEERDRRILETAEADAEHWGHNVQIYLEQEPGSGGKESAQLSVKMLARFPVHIDHLTGSKQRVKGGQKVPGQAKITRAGPLAAQAEGGNVRLLSGCPWIGDYLEELCAFPESAHSDQVDASSGAFNKLAQYATIGTDAPEMRGRGLPDLSRHGIQLDRGPLQTPGRKPREGGGRTISRVR